MLQMDKEYPVDIVEHTNHAVVYPNGYLNGSTGEKIDAACNELMHKGQDRIIINFGNVETVNTMGIANLVSVLEKVGHREGVVCFSNLSDSNRQIFDVLDISRAVLIFDDEAQACTHLATRYEQP
jgi:anti-anti-sigma factor